MYLLRWRFDFLNKPSRFGMWSNPGTNDIDKACFQNKEGLVSAKIEGKNILTRETKVLAEVSGQDYLNFQWMATLKLKSQLTEVIGLKILSRYNEIEVLKDGSVSLKKLKNDNVNFATFGR
jgi:hypothetical protein